jgi:sialate O-acetylesterase
VTSRGHHTDPRVYTVPLDAVREGDNELLVGVFDTGGPGGIYGAAKDLFIRAGSVSIPLAADWELVRGETLKQLPPYPWPPALHANLPTVLSNGMIAPLVPFAIRGVIWYQGESNVGRAKQYRSLFPALIRDWRARWGQGQFPFYFVQIAPYNYGPDHGETGELREAQAFTQSEPRTGMVVTMDIGDPKDIHPRNKQEVGRRLSLWAIAKTYGIDVACAGPRFLSMKREGAALRLVFDGAVVAHGEPACFEIAATDGRFRPAKAEVHGREVVLTGLDDSRAARYAWGSTDVPNLFGESGLPMVPFRTDPP